MSGIVAADNTGVETDGYETVEVKLKKMRKKVGVKYRLVVGSNEKCL